MNPTAPQQPTPSRRHLALVLSLALLAGGTWLHFTEGQSEREFASAGMIRIGLVLGMLWLAWPSLKRPAEWLPPSIAVAVVAGLIMIAAQPRLILVVLPVVGGLVTLGAVIRAFRRRR